jgi:hypothetical protein
MQLGPVRPFQFDHRLWAPRANAETPTSLDAIIGAGVLRVGLTEDYRPCSVAGSSDNVEVIDVDMAMSLA